MTNLSLTDLINLKKFCEDMHELFLGTVSEKLWSDRIETVEKELSGRVEKIFTA